MTKEHSLIYFSFQFLLISTVFLLFPSIETLIVIIVWLNFSVVCFTMYVLEVPIIFVTGVTLLTFKTATFLYYNTLFGLIVLLPILVVFWVVNERVKNVVYIKKSINEFVANEKIIADHFYEIKVIGALGLQVDFCALLLSYAFFFEGPNLFCLMSTEWDFFLPGSFIVIISFTFITCMEHIICVCFNQTYGFKFANQLLKVTKRALNLGGLTFLGYNTYDYYAVGGMFDPNLNLPFVKSRQIQFLGANSDSAEGVRLLRKLKLLGGGNPPCKEGTTMVDTDQIKRMIQTINQKNKIYDALLNKNLSELSEKLVYDPKMSEEENKKRCFETWSPPNITNDDSPHDKVQVGIRPSDNPFPGKKKDK